VIDPTPGCSYHARCPLARDRCRRETPPLTPRGPDHLVACFER
jgi:oligopeptide/dipeptide ABC transporter ATP-binding protein